MGILSGSRRRVATTITVGTLAVSGLAVGINAGVASAHHPIVAAGSPVCLDEETGTWSATFTATSDDPGRGKEWSGTGDHSWDWTNESNSQSWNVTSTSDSVTQSVSASWRPDGGTGIAGSATAYKPSDCVPPPPQCPDGSNPGDLNGDGSADENDCGYVPPEVIEVPAIPESVDPCGDFNAYWIVPNDTDVFDWEEDAEGNLTVTILTPNTTFVGGVTTHNFGQVPDSGEACEPPPSDGALAVTGSGDCAAEEVTFVVSSDSDTLDVVFTYTVDGVAGAAGIPAGQGSTSITVPAQPGQSVLFDITAAQWGYPGAVGYDPDGAGTSTSVPTDCVPTPARIFEVTPTPECQNGAPVLVVTVAWEGAEEDTDASFALYGNFLPEIGEAHVLVGTSGERTLTYTETTDRDGMPITQWTISGTISFFGPTGAAEQSAPEQSVVIPTDCDEQPPTDACPDVPGNQPPGTDCSPRSRRSTPARMFRATSRSAPTAVRIRGRQRPRPTRRSTPARTWMASSQPVPTAPRGAAGDAADHGDASSRPGPARDALMHEA